MHNSYKEPVFIAHSNLVPQGTTVLTNTQRHTLGIALRKIHDFFYPLYGSHAWWAMDTAFKFDQPMGGDPTGEPVLIVKQARPYPGWGPTKSGTIFEVWGCGRLGV